MCIRDSGLTVYYLGESHTVLPQKAEAGGVTVDYNPDFLGAELDSRAVLSLFLGEDWPFWLIFKNKEGKIVYTGHEVCEELLSPTLKGAQPVSLEKLADGSVQLLVLTKPVSIDELAGGLDVFLHGKLHNSIDEPALVELRSHHHVDRTLSFRDALLYGEEEGKELAWGGFSKTLHVFLGPVFPYWLVFNITRDGCPFDKVRADGEPRSPGLPADLYLNGTRLCLDLLVERDV